MITANDNTTCCNTTVITNTVASGLSLKVDGAEGSPVAGAIVYQNDILRGASNVAYIFLNKQVLTILDDDFTFDAAEGEVDISPNKFFYGDSLIIKYTKNL